MLDKKSCFPKNINMILMSGIPIYYECTQYLPTLFWRLLLYSLERAY